MRGAIGVGQDYQKNSQLEVNMVRRSESQTQRRVHKNKEWEIGWCKRGGERGGDIRVRFDSLT